LLTGGNFEFKITNQKLKLNSNSSARSQTTTFRLAPRFGYFMKERFAIGAEFSMELTNVISDLDDDLRSSKSIVAFGPFLRYYFKPGVFLESSASIGSVAERSSSIFFSNDRNYNVAQFSVSSGYALFLSKNVAVEPMFGFRHRSSKQNESQSGETTINSEVFLSVGFQVYLR